jgi:hypothetical protein
VRLTTYPWAVAFLLVVAVFSASATAAPPPAQPKDEFAAYKSRGDLARVTGRLSVAQENYEKALALRFDPLVSGRLGLVRLAQRDFEDAAGRLYRAAHDASLSEKDQAIFFKALSDARREVCRVDIKVDQTDAQLAIEIDKVERSKGLAAFWLFLKPGKHMIRAKLPGFQDAVETVITERGCEANVVVELHLEPIVPASRAFTTALMQQNKTLVERSKAFVEKSEASVDVGPLYTAKPRPNPAKTNVSGGFVGGVGVWIPFGMTPGAGIAMGVGGQVHAGLRSRSWWEIGVDLRLGWSLEDAKFDAGSVQTWGFALAPCGRYGAHLFGCVLAQINVGTYSASPPWLLPAVGVRGGYEFHLNERLHVRAFVEGTLHFGTPAFIRNDQLLWTVIPMAGAVGISALRFF